MRASIKRGEYGEEKKLKGVFIRQNLEIFNPTQVNNVS